LLLAVLFDFVCFFLVFFFAAIGAVYHRRMFATELFAPSPTATKKLRCRLRL
jgi:hypothetical protein